MRLRTLAILAIVTMISTGLVLGGSSPVVATPVATNDALYAAYGRVFPDPHGCTQGAPTTSPFAKGNVCAVQFVQWDEAVQGVEFLEGKVRAVHGGAVGGGAPRGGREHDTWPRSRS